MNLYADLVWTTDYIKAEGSETYDKTLFLSWFLLLPPNLPIGSSLTPLGC